MRQGKEKRASERERERAGSMRQGKEKRASERERKRKSWKYETGEREKRE